MPLPNPLKADVAHLIKQHLGKAIEVLHSLEKEAPFDAIFIDADKKLLSTILSLG